MSSFVIVFNVAAAARHVQTRFMRPVLQVQTLSFRLKTILEYSEGGTRLAMPKTICATGYLVIEAWFRGY